MSILSIVIVLVIVGIGLWAINQVTVIDGNIKKIINIVVIVAVVLWLLHLFAPHLGLGAFRI